MMRRQLWLELGPQWPLENWDHWMRLETTAKVPPELPEACRAAQHTHEQSLVVLQQSLCFAACNSYVFSNSNRAHQYKTR